jgi:hypothetical protein
LASTVRFALRYQGDAACYAAVIETLIAAGADVRAVSHPTGNQLIDDVLRRLARRSNHFRPNFPEDGSFDAGIRHLAIRDYDPITRNASFVNSFSFG